MQDNGDPRVEVQFWTILKYGIALLIVAIVVHVLMYWMFNFLNAYEKRNEPRPSPMAPAQPVQPPEPRLQVTPVQDLQALRKTEDEILNSYGWVDQNAGVVRIPISQAMKMVVQQENASEK